MATTSTRTYRILNRTLPALLFFCYGNFALRAGAQKLKIEELVARHLESMGTAEARAAAKNTLAGGTAQVKFHMPAAAQLSGTSALLADGRMMHISMMFSSQEYHSERLVYDGKRVDVGEVEILKRSTLSDFIYHYGPAMLREGLMCATMTTAWALLDLDGRQPKLDYSGLKKISGKQLHELKYRPKRDPGDIQISLYFDPETFRHVYSQYRVVVRGGVGQRGVPTAANPDLSGPEDTFFKLEEWFEDFRTAGGLTLPHSYRLRFSREGRNPFLCEYGIALTQVAHNQPIDPNFFVISRQ